MFVLFWGQTWYGNNSRGELNKLRLVRACRHATACMKLIKAYFNPCLLQWDKVDFAKQKKDDVLEKKTRIILHGVWDIEKRQPSGCLFECVF